MKMLQGRISRNRGIYGQASLTVEASLVLPIFLYFMIVFLYFIQIFTVQEQIQAAITKMGIDLSKSAYIIKDFPSLEDADKIDFTIFGSQLDTGLEEYASGLASHGILNVDILNYLNANAINKSCIKNGIKGLDFSESNLFNDNIVDIKVNYQVTFPVPIFIISKMNLSQRVRLHSWTGYEVEPAYQTDTEDGKEEMVYIAETGNVYHKTDQCSHIKLTVTSVQGIPESLRNSNGAKYYPCESCCSNNLDPSMTYYITQDGTRYHTKRNCSRIKRSVKEIPISQVGNRTPCKRCYK